MAGTKKSIIVSYSATPSFISTSSWAQILQTLKSQLPLRNVHWKSTSRNSIRTIHELDVSLVNLDTVRASELTTQIPSTLLEKPLLNIYVITCEVPVVVSVDSTTCTDDRLRTTILKPIVPRWRSRLESGITPSNHARTKNGSSYMSFVQTPEYNLGRSSHSKVRFWTRYGAISIRKSENGELLLLYSCVNCIHNVNSCIQLVWSNGANNPAAWAEFLNKLRDGILSAFELAVVQREDEVRRSEGQRQMPGWNFCTFFILKVCTYYYYPPCLAHLTCFNRKA